jgi:hypothetical protein
MRAFDRRQLIIEFGHRLFASCWWERDGNEGSARSVLTQPPNVEIPWHHLLLQPEVDTAHGN